MKILRISLRNIASLGGTHTVDFTRDPLRTAGLFAISGLTGSGKSTLLDALCLALFERTPRLNAVRGTVKLADGDGSITQKDPGNLLRRGTGEGFAEVAFVGVDGAVYTARWTVRRARNRPEGSLQAPEMALFRGDVRPGENGALEQGGRKSEVLPAIEAKIGLSFEQFTRAVLLAQNDFATFLKADDKDRAEILQALTGTERFEQISIAVQRRSAAEQRAVEQLRAKREGNPPLDPEARAAAEAAAADAEKAWKEAQEQLAVRTAHASWFERLGKLTKETDEADARLKAQEAARTAAEPRRIELRYTEEASRDARPLRDALLRLHAETAQAAKLRDEAATAEQEARRELEERQRRHTAASESSTRAQAAIEGARPQLLRARDLDAKLVPLAQHLAAATLSRETADGRVTQLIKERGTIVGRRDEAAREQAPLRLKRDSLATCGAFAPDAQAWLQRLDHAARSRGIHDQTASRLSLRQREEDTARAAVETERANEPAIREAAATAAAAFTQAEAATREHDGEAIERARSEALASEAALRDLEEHFRQLAAASAQAKAIENEIAHLQAAIAADTTALGALRDEEIPRLEQQRDGARRAHDLAEAAVTDAAIALREELVSGHPCPVCGAVDHPHAIHPPAAEAAALRVLREDWTAREKELRTLSERAVALEATRKTRLAHAEEKGATRKSLLTQIEALEARRHDHPMAAAILRQPPADRAAALIRQIEAIQHAIRTAAASDKARKEAEKVRDQRRIDRERTATALVAFEKRFAELTSALSEKRATREAAGHSQLEAEKEFRDSFEQLTPLFAGISGARQAWDENATAFRDRLAADMETFLSVEKRLGELDRTVRDCDAALAPASEAVQRAQSDIATQRRVEAEARTAHEETRAQRATIFSGRPAEMVEKELGEALRLAAETREQNTRDLEKADKQLAATTATQKNTAQSLDHARLRESEAGTHLETWLAGFAQRSGRSLDRTALDLMLDRNEAWIGAEREALNAMDRAVQNADGILAAHRKMLEEHRAACPTADDEPTVAAALAALRTSLQQIEQTRDAARATLLADDRRRHENSALDTEISDRARRAEPWLKLDQLIGSSDGAKFRGIAQRRTLDILLGYANAQLDQLAARYRLERLPESLNLIVVDRDMGDERRSVHSLSGGESFLVSLALALALASLTSNRLRIESLFIDEGFGSLDPETLNIAMSALMHLEAQGRKVGVISHVAEMTDAIPVQIRVVKGRSGASRLVVPGAAEPSTDPVTVTVLEPPSGTLSPQVVAETAGQILTILRRELAAGRNKISTRALREEIGCPSEVFNAARQSLAAETRLEGKSLLLVASS